MSDSTDDAEDEEAELNQCGPQDGAAAQEPAAPEAAKPEQETNPAAEASTDKPEQPAAPNQEPAASQTPAEQKPADQKPADQKPAETEEELKERLEAVRERIKKENQRKIDDRNEKIAASRKKVQELNARFSDWYYVVSDSAYKKLKVSRDQLIVPKGSSAAQPPAGGQGLPPGLPPGFNLPTGN